MSNATTSYDIGQKMLDTGGAPISIKIAAVATYRGRAAGVIAGTGYARPIVYNDPTYRFIGVFGGAQDNSAGSAGDKTQIVFTRGLYKFTCTATQADVKKDVWFQDDNSVSTVKGSSVIKAGTIETIDADGGVWVRITPYGCESINSLTPSTTVTTLTAADNTLTAAQVLGGIILKTTANGTLTLPTAALLVAAMGNPAIGSTIDLIIRNTSGGAETLAAGTGGTMAAGNTNTTADAHSHLFKIRITNAASGTEAYTAYSVVDSAH